MCLVSARHAPCFHYSLAAIPTFVVLWAENHVTYVAPHVYGRPTTENYYILRYDTNMALIMLVDEIFKALDGRKKYCTRGIFRLA